jgi:hypothetical protein
MSGDSRGNLPDRLATWTVPGTGRDIAGARSLLSALTSDVLEVPGTVNFVSGTSIIGDWLPCADVFKEPGTPRTSRRVAAP